MAEVTPDHRALGVVGDVVVGPPDVGREQEAVGVEVALEHARAVVL